MSNNNFDELYKIVIDTLFSVDEKYKYGNYRIFEITDVGDDGKILQYEEFNKYLSLPESENLDLIIESENGINLKIDRNNDIDCSGSLNFKINENFYIINENTDFIEIDSIFFKIKKICKESVLFKFIIENKYIFRFQTSHPILNIILKKNINELVESIESYITIKLDTISKKIYIKNLKTKLYNNFIFYLISLGFIDNELDYVKSFNIKNNFAVNIKVKYQNIKNFKNILDMCYENNFFNIIKNEIYNTKLIYYFDNIKKSSKTIFFGENINKESSLSLSDLYNEVDFENKRTEQREILIDDDILENENRYIIESNMNKKESYINYIFNNDGIKNAFLKKFKTYYPEYKNIELRAPFFKNNKDIKLNKIIYQLVVYFLIKNNLDTQINERSNLVDMKYFVDHKTDVDDNIINILEYLKKKNTSKKYIYEIFAYQFSNIIDNTDERTEILFFEKILNTKDDEYYLNEETKNFDIDNNILTNSNLLLLNDIIEKSYFIKSKFDEEKIKLWFSKSLNHQINKTIYPIKFKYADLNFFLKHDFVKDTINKTLNSDKNYLIPQKFMYYYDKYIVNIVILNLIYKLLTDFNKNDQDQDRISQNKNFKKAKKLLMYIIEDLEKKNLLLKNYVDSFLQFAELLDEENIKENEKNQKKTKYILNFLIYYFQDSIIDINLKINYIYEKLNIYKNIKFSEKSNFYNIGIVNSFLLNLENFRWEKNGSDYNKVSDYSYDIINKNDENNIFFYFSNFDNKIGPLKLIFTDLINKKNIELKIGNLDLNNLNYNISENLDEIQDKKQNIDELLKKYINIDGLEDYKLDNDKYKYDIYDINNDENLKITYDSNLKKFNFFNVEFDNYSNLIKKYEELNNNYIKIYSYFNQFNCDLINKLKELNNNKLFNLDNIDLKKNITTYFNEELTNIITSSKIINIDDENKINNFELYNKYFEIDNNTYYINNDGNIIYNKQKIYKNGDKYYECIYLDIYYNGINIYIHNFNKNNIIDTSLFLINNKIKNNIVDISDLKIINDFEQNIIIRDNFIIKLNEISDPRNLNSNILEKLNILGENINIQYNKKIELEILEKKEFTKYFKYKLNYTNIKKGIINYKTNYYNFNIIDENFLYIYDSASNIIDPSEENIPNIKYKIDTIIITKFINDNEPIDFKYTYEDSNYKLDEPSKNLLELYIEDKKIFSKKYIDIKYSLNDLTFIKLDLEKLNKNNYDFNFDTVNGYNSKYKDNIYRIENDLNFLIKYIKNEKCYKFNTNNLEEVGNNISNTHNYNNYIFSSNVIEEDNIYINLNNKLYNSFNYFIFELINNSNMYRLEDEIKIKGDDENIYKNVNQLNEMLIGFIYKYYDYNIYNYLKNSIIKSISNFLINGSNRSLTDLNVKKEIYKIIFYYYYNYDLKEESIIKSIKSSIKKYNINLKKLTLPTSPKDCLDEINTQKLNNIIYNNLFKNKIFIYDYEKYNNILIQHDQSENEIFNYNNKIDDMIFNIYYKKLNNIVTSKYNNYFKLYKLFNSINYNLLNFLMFKNNEVKLVYNLTLKIIKNIKTKNLELDTQDNYLLNIDSIYYDKVFKELNLFYSNDLFKFIDNKFKDINLKLKTIDDYTSRINKEILEKSKTTPILSEIEKNSIRSNYQIELSKDNNDLIKNYFGINFNNMIVLINNFYINTDSSDQFDKTVIFIDYINSLNFNS